MIKIAVPKGRLQQSATKALAPWGVELPVDPRGYRMRTRPGVSAQLVKARAIPQLVALGCFDVGFCGTDLVLEAGADECIPLVDLAVDQVRIVVGATQKDILEKPPARPLVIATEYPNLAAKWALEKGLANIILPTWGSTEGYAPGIADLVVDCASTGDTLRANGLTEIDFLARSSTHMVVNRIALAHGLLHFFLDQLLRSFPVKRTGFLFLAADIQGRILTGHGGQVPQWTTESVCEDTHEEIVTLMLARMAAFGIRQRSSPRFIYRGMNEMGNMCNVFLFHAKFEPNGPCDPQGTFSWVVPQEVEWSAFYQHALRAANLWKDT